MFLAADNSTLLRLLVGSVGFLFAIGLMMCCMAGGSRSSLVKALLRAHAICLYHNIRIAFCHGRGPLPEPLENITRTALHCCHGIDTTATFASPKHDSFIAVLFVPQPQSYQPLFLTACADNLSTECLCVNAAATKAFHAVQQNNIYRVIQFLALSLLQ